MHMRQQECGKDRDRMICQLLQCQRLRTVKDAFRRLSTSFKPCPKMVALLTVDKNDIIVHNSDYVIQHNIILL